MAEIFDYDHYLYWRGECPFNVGDEVPSGTMDDDKDTLYHDGEATVVYLDNAGGCHVKVEAEHEIMVERGDDIPDWVNAPAKTEDVVIEPEREPDVWDTGTLHEKMTIAIDRKRFHYGQMNDAQSLELIVHSHMMNLYFGMQNLLEGQIALQKLEAYFEGES